MGGNGVGYNLFLYTLRPVIRNCFTVMTKSRKRIARISVCLAVEIELDRN